MQKVKGFQSGKGTYVLFLPPNIPLIPDPITPKIEPLFSCVLELEREPSLEVEN